MTAHPLAATFFPQVFSGSGGTIYALALTLVALALLFAGRSVVKGLVFLVAGLAGAAFGAALAEPLLGTGGVVLGGVVGFLVGGVIGVLLMEFGIGLATGYFGYLAMLHLTGSHFLSEVVGVVLFLVGLAVSWSLLELATSVLGGIIIYGVLIFFGVAPFLAAVLAVVLTAAGVYVRWERRRRRERRGHA